MRAAIKKLLARDPRFEVIGEAKDGRDAVEKVRALHPDVCTMDFNMPNLDGADAVREIMRIHPTPVVMLSAHTHEGARETFEALARRRRRLSDQAVGRSLGRAGQDWHRPARKAGGRRAVAADADGARAAPGAAAAPDGATPGRRRRAEGRRRRRVDGRTGGARPLLAALPRRHVARASSSSSTCPPASPPRSPSGSTRCAPSACAKPPTAIVPKRDWR